MLKGRIEGNDGEDPTSCSGLRQRLLRRPRTRVAALALLISARRSDTGSVTLQDTRSSGHAPGHRCARFGPFGIRHLVQPAELRLAAFRCPGAPHKMEGRRCPQPNEPPFLTESVRGRHHSDAARPVPGRDALRQGCSTLQPLRTFRFKGSGYAPALRCARRTSSEKQRRPQCDSSSDAERDPLLERLRAAREARSDE